MLHAPDPTLIISLDLATHTDDTVDIREEFPFSEIHAVSSSKPVVDTLKKELADDINLHTPQSVRTDTPPDISTLDIAHGDLSKKRGLTRGDAVGHDPYTIDLFPPLREIYGSLDVREGVIKAKRRYSDLFIRSLPFSLQIKRTSKRFLTFFRAYRRPTFGILLILIGCSMPVLFYVEKLTKSAYTHLTLMKDSTTIEEVAGDISDARKEFERANILFLPYRYLPLEKIELARRAIDGGLALSRGLDRIMSTTEKNGSGSLLSRERDATDSLYRPSPTDIRPLAFFGIDEPTTWLDTHRNDILAFRSELIRAGDAYSKVSSQSDPRAVEVAHIGRAIEKFVGIIDFYLTHSDDVEKLLGKNAPERYMVMNQNRDEIRANGGFPGSVITFTMYKGNISDYRTDDVYYYDWNLYPYKEAPPPGLALIAGNYGLRDVNYYADFRETLDKANTFIERSGDPTITVGLAIHQGLIEDILGDVGPVKLDSISEPFTKENFSLLMSTLVEARYGEVTSAKDILAEFVHAFVREIHEKRAYEEVLTHIEDALKNGEVLFASRNDDIDSFLSEWRRPLPWEKNITLKNSENTEISLISSGSLLEKVTGLIGRDGGELISSAPWTWTGSGPNWAYPLLTSLSGNKSDRLIERTYSATSEKTGLCSVENTLTFTHKHSYNEAYEDKILLYLRLIGITDPSLRDKLLTIEGRGKNKTYMRILVPLASKLSGNPTGIDESATPNYREFAFTLDTPIGGSTSKTIRYTTTLTDCHANTTLDWFRQPGLTHMTFVSD